MQYIGTAGWNIPKLAGPLFPSSGTHLERYSSILGAVEINSSFYRDHRPKTYARWRDLTPENFRFSVKLCQRFTHQQKLRSDEAQLRETLTGIQELGEKLGVLLVQLPPSLEFDSSTAEQFFEKIRAHYNGPIAFEPRHFSWTGPEARILLLKFGLTKVRADPELCPVGQLTAWERSDLCYFRLHGSPEIYRSNYSSLSLAKIASSIAEVKADHTWCIFDNTTFGHAFTNAVDLQSRLASGIAKTEWPQKTG